MELYLTVRPVSVWQFLFKQEVIIMISIMLGIRLMRTDNNHPVFLKGPDPLS